MYSFLSLPHTILYWICIPLHFINFFEFIMNKLLFSWNVFVYNAASVLLISVSPHWYSPYFSAQATVHGGGSVVCQTPPQNLSWQESWVIPCLLRNCWLCTAPPWTLTCGWGPSRSPPSLVVVWDPSWPVCWRSSSGLSEMETGRVRLTCSLTQVTHSTHLRLDNRWVIIGWTADESLNNETWTWIFFHICYL